MNRNNYPIERVSEFIGQIQFSKNDDIEIAEYIAGVEYNSLDDLISATRGSVEPKYLKQFEKTVEEIKNNPFFTNPY